MRVTDAAIGATWLLGIVLVIMGSWYTSKWLYTKVLMVVAISAIHSIVHRRWKEAKEEGASSNDAIPYAIVAFALMAVLLVVLKWSF